MILRGMGNEQALIPRGMSMLRAGWDHAKIVIQAIRRPTRIINLKHTSVLREYPRERVVRSFAHQAQDLLLTRPREPIILRAAPLAGGEDKDA